MRFTIRRANIGAVLALGALLVAPSLLAQQTAAVQGTVTDGASGAPISGAVVAIVGTTFQGVTNVLGNYRIAGVPAGAITIQVRRIGFKTLSAPVTLAEGQEFAGTYALTASVMQLEEIVVTGTAGRLERKAQAATVTDVDVAGLRQVAPTPTVANVLQSRIRGVSVPGASGTSGAWSKIGVRGASSISLGNEPLVSIAGIRVNSQGAPQFFTGGQSYERLNDLEPGDIESVELVKGPAAATLYGADASPGVIQIITKRGRPGTGKFTQSLNFDYNSIDRNFTPRTNYGRCSVANDTTANNLLCFGKGAGTLVSDNPLLRQNAFRTGQMIGVNWSGRGGGQNYGYYTSLNRESEDGVLPNNGFNRASGRVNFNWVPSPNLTLDSGAGVTLAVAALPDNANKLFGWLGNSHLGSPPTRTVNGAGPNGWVGNQRDVAAMEAINNQRQPHRT